MAEDVLFTIGADARQSIREFEKLLKLMQQLETQAGPKVAKASQATGDQVRKLGFAFQRFGVNGVAAFGEIYAAIGPVGIALGALTLGVVGLIKVLQQLARAGIDAFKFLVDQSLEASKSLELTRAQFNAFFQGDVQAAEATIQRLFGLARKLGSETLEIGRAFLPQAESLDQLEQIVSLATALARFQPEQGIAGARIALQEFLSGEERSLVRRFEIPQNIANQFAEALDTQGIQGALNELQAYLEDTGRSIEDLSDTFDVKVGVIREAIRQLGTISGDPILEELSSQFTDFFDILDGEEKNLEQIANLFGETVGQAIGFLGDGLQAIVDGGGVEALRDIVELLGVLSNFTQSLGTLFGFNTESVATFVEGLNKFAQETRETAEAVLFTINVLRALKRTLDLVFTLITSPIEFFTHFREEMNDFTIDITELIQNTAESIHQYRRGLEELDQTAQDFAERQGDLADESGAEAFLDARDAAAEYEAQLTRTEEALTKVQEAIDEFNLDRARDLEDLQIQQARKAVDQEIANAEKRIDLALENSRRIADIEKRNQDQLQDQEIDFQRDLEDIAIDRSRRQIEVEQDLADDRLDIERDYLRRLEDINRQFDFNQRQAIRDNDARQFVRLQEQRQFELDNARIQRDRDLEDAKAKAEEKRQDLAEQLEYEVQDAELANQRKLEDIQRTLDRELAAQRENYDQELDDQKTLEQRKTDELARSNQEQLDDFNRTWARKLEDLRANYAEELAILQEFQGRELELVQQHNKAILQLSQARYRPGGGAGSPSELGGDELIGLNTGPGLNDVPIEELRELAHRLLSEVIRNDAMDQGQIVALRQLIQDGTQGQLLQIIRGLQALLANVAGGNGDGGGGGGGSGPRRFGGSSGPYQNVGFEGNEPEIVQFGSRANVTPLSRTFFSPPGPQSGSSVSLQFQNEFVNPLAVPPEMRAAIREEVMATFMGILNSGVLVKP